MSIDMQNGLLITAIGMGLVFVVIIFLWGLMALMMRLTSGEKKQRKTSEQEQVAEIEPAIAEDVLLSQPITQMEKKLKAIAAAVAVAIAIDKDGFQHKGRKMAKQLENTSAWQTVHRTRQLERRR